MERSFYLLLQVNESTFPIGGYAHSYGLETYVQKRLVTSAESAYSYIEQNIKNAFLYTELLAACLAYDAAEKGDIKEVVSLEEIIFAGKIPMEIRQASEKLGSRFLKTASVLLEAETIFTKYQEETMGKSVSHAVAYGVFCSAGKVLREQALSTFLYSQVSAIVTNAVKTIPLRQTDGQRILTRCHSLFPEVLERLRTLSKEDLCRSCPGLDVRAMQHETLYSRLYMS